MQSLIDEVLERTHFRSNPYFSTLREGQFEREDFIETQIQFFFAVVFFSRPMAALAAKIPSAGGRMEILRNVWEEHGEGDSYITHETTFRHLLTRLGVTEDAEINRRGLWPEVRVFNSALVGACVLDEFIIGCATLGIIERMFSEISAWIGQSIVDLGWIARDQLIHYNLHEQLDTKHAQDFFDVLQGPWDEDPAHRYYIEQGLLMGGRLFNDLYLGLHENRARRYFREYLGPHTRA